MGITLKDIYDQREMLRRGEEIARAAKQAEERERLRDHFAAAALTGLLSNVQRYQNGPVTEQAFELADFMLRERASRTGQKIAKSDSSRAVCPDREADPYTESDEKRGDLHTKRDTTLPRNGTPAKGSVQVEGTEPQPTLTDAEREAVETAALEADAHQHTQRAAALRGLLERMK